MAYFELEQVAGLRRNERPLLAWKGWQDSLEYASNSANSVKGAERP
jgi:hypothetical protein